MKIINKIYFCMSLFIMYNAHAIAKNKNAQNVIWIFSDQHRAQALGYMGDPNICTPNLDGLAKESVSFMQAYSGCPWSTPFRGSLLTGKYPNNAVIKTPQHLDRSLPLITDILNENGYLTAYFGKWHLYGYNQRVFVPKEERGRFNIWLGYENNNRNRFKSYIHGHDIWGRNDTTANAEKLEGYETDKLVDKVINFLNNRPQDKPFFIVLSLHAPHDPYIAPDKYMDMFNADSIHLRINVPPIERIKEKSQKDMQGYYASIKNIDDNIGRLLEVMKNKGLFDNTNIFYFSDHGDCLGSHGYEKKSSPWQESVRIPFIVRPANSISDAYTKTDAMLNTIDIAPTTLGLCGIEQPGWMVGFDYSNRILSPEIPRTKEEPDAVLLQHIYPKDFACLDRPWRGVITQDGWKYIVIENQPIMLFNLNEDPYELNNLVYLTEYREKRKSLANKLRNLLEKAGDNFKVNE